jgi:hypothetical protein
VRQPKPCKLCRRSPATVPDRTRTTGRFVPEICAACHAHRLAGDLADIIQAAQGRATPRDR